MNGPKIVAYYPIGPGVATRVGENWVTSIEEVMEPGEMAHIPVLYVYRNDKLWKRVPAHLVEVEYEVDDE